MTTAEVFTYGDAIAALNDFTQGHAVGIPTSALRRNILSAYREIATAHDWSFLISPSGRVQLVAPQTTGTVVFDLTGGATCERQLTLTGATFPTDAADYSIRFDGIVCDIERYYSSTVVSLDAILSPGADVASTTYSLWPRYYQLPSDFISMPETEDESLDWGLGRYISPSEMHQRTRYETDTGDVAYYTIGPAPDLHGVMALYVHPPSDATETLDFSYKRKSRQIRYTGTDTNDKAGTVTMTANSTAVTGSSTAFTSLHVGSVIRTAGNSDLPTGIEGTNSWVEQRSIIEVADATHLTLDAYPTSAHSAVKYCISDPIDLEASAYEAFVWLAKKHLATERKLADLRDIERAYETALMRAKSGDSRTRHRRVCGPGTPRYRRLRDICVNRTES
uniref:Uncharacterized protein n=1 Tax=viral metagenome TaxID=1070528 RepID=A0A6H1ZUT6_9ZZZZ